MIIELTDEAALVLFDLLSDYGAQEDMGQMRVRHPAECNALSALSVELERQMIPRVHDHYPDRLRAARERMGEVGKR
jgi:hypothetical protein